MTEQREEANEVKQSANSPCEKCQIWKEGMLKASEENGKLKGERIALEASLKEKEERLLAGCQHDDPSWCDENTCMVPLRKLRKKEAELEAAKKQFKEFSAKSLKWFRAYHEIKSLKEQNERYKKGLEKIASGDFGEADLVFTARALLLEIKPEGEVK